MGPRATYPIREGVRGLTLVAVAERDNTAANRLAVPRKPGRARVRARARMRGMRGLFFRRLRNYIYRRMPEDNNKHVLCVYVYI